MKRCTRRLAVTAAGIIFACFVSLAGCGKEEAKTEIIVENEGQMEGTLVSFEGKTLVVEEADENYTFDVSGASIDTVNMRSGDELVIYYDGKLEDKDTSGVKVTSVKDLGKNEHQTEKQAVGTLVKLTENTVTIRQNDGVELLFNANNCQHEFKNGIREGNWIVITYIGEITGTDTKNVTVVKITDDDPNIVKKEQKKMEIKAVDEKVYATAGVHIRESYTTDSKVVGSLAKGGSIKRTGVCENGWSRVEYKSKDAYIYGEYLTTKKPKKDAPAAKVNGEPVETVQIGNEPQPVVLWPDTSQQDTLAQSIEQAKPEKEEQTKEQAKPEKEEQTKEQAQPEEEKQTEEQAKPEEEKQTEEQAQPEEEEQTEEQAKPEEEEQTEEPQPEKQEKQTFSGTVLDVSMNTLTVKEKKQKYTLNIADAEHEYANGIQTGNTVTVTYVGSLDDPDNLIVLKVQDSDPNEAAKNAEYVGVITDATMNTLTIETEDGAVMTFIKDGAKNSLDGDLDGQKVKITADMTASDTDENIFRAKRIDPA